MPIVTNMVTIGTEVKTYTALFCIPNRPRRLATNNSDSLTILRLRVGDAARAQLFIGGFRCLLRRVRLA